MSIKLFVTDLDGTLLPTGTRVSEKNIRAVRDMVEAGVIFTLATGRMYRAAFAIAKSLRVDVPLITYNGALIKSTSGEVIHEDCLPQDLILELIDFCRLNGWHVQTYDDDILRFAELNRLAESYMASVKVEGAAVGWDGLKKYSARSYKLLLVTDGDAASKDCIVELKKMFGDRIDAVQSNPQYVEITTKGVSKASALELMAARYGLTIEETLAIGDSGNDLPMLRAAGVSVAMGNASDEVKAACDHVTGLCVEDGFADAVYNFVLNQPSLLDKSTA